jgi:hypothetical protein
MLIIFSLKLSELKAGLSDRSRLLEEIERHLLVQEVTNKLLVADLQRRELEVQYLRDARKKAIIRRWRTYGGTDLIDRRRVRRRPKNSASMSHILSTGFQTGPEKKQFVRPSSKFPETFKLRRVVRNNSSDAGERTKDI